MGRDCKKEKRGKNWGETNIKPKEWGKTNGEESAKETGARQKVSQKNGARLMERRAQRKLGRAIK